MSYSLVSSSWDKEEINAINKVVDTGYFTAGENVREFEQKFAEYHGMKYGIMVNSGSSANLAATAALFYKNENPLKRGDEVLVPALSWSTTYNPLQQYGLKIKFVDINNFDLNVDIEALESAITDKTRLIVGVSILGNPAALDRMRALADKHGIYFLEDNCESTDAELHGRKTGTFGDLNTFSFFFSHHISTMEGGMILTNDLELMHLCRAIRAHGWNRDLPEDSPLYEKGDDDLFEVYRFIVPGYNLRSNELSGAIGQVQLEKLNDFTNIRRENLKIFHELFEGDSRFSIQKENGKSSAFSFPIILNTECKDLRKKVFQALKKENIEFRLIAGGCFPRHDVIRFYDFETVGDLPNANRAHDYGFFVGNHPRNLEEEVRVLYDVLDKCVDC